MFKISNFRKGILLFIIYIFYLHTFVFIRSLSVDIYSCIHWHSDSGMEDDGVTMKFISPKRYQVGSSSMLSSNNLWIHFLLWNEWFLWKWQNLILPSLNTVYIINKKLMKKQNVISFAAYVLKPFLWYYVTKNTNMHQG